MKILYLYAEVMGYTLAIIRELAKRGIEVHVIHWDHKKLTPYKAPSIYNVHFYNRSELSLKQIVELTKELAPVLTVVSGWMDRDYMTVAKYLRIEGSTVVLGLDAPWQGTIRQWGARILGFFGYFSKFYSHAWVAGLYQYEYAQKLGFGKKFIVFGCYSADLELFNQVYAETREDKGNHYPHQFLYIGRFEPIKGLDTLLKAWENLGEQKGDWTLHLVGNGSLKSTLETHAGVVVEDFLQPEQLREKIARSGCFLLPSHSEPWGVVVHEVTAAGLPIIASDIVGAATTFLISGLNGYSFTASDAIALENRIRQVIRLTDQELQTMAQHSHALAQRITPLYSAYNLLSTISD